MLGRNYILDPHDTPPLYISVKLSSILARSSPQCFYKDGVAYNIYREGRSSATVIGMWHWKPLRMHHIQQWIQCTWRYFVNAPMIIWNLYQIHTLNHHTPQLSYVMIELKQVEIELDLYCTLNASKMYSNLELQTIHNTIGPRWFL